jgi:acetyl-CoA carboxylase biotin carboxyl carrier protein
MLSDGDLRNLAAAMSRSGIARIEIEGSGGRLSLQVSPDAAPVLAGGELPSAACITVAAPSMGIFCHAHPDGLFPPCGEGTSVEAGQILAFLQLDRLLLPVQAAGPGRIAAVLAAEGRLVGYGDPLFTMTP